VNLFHPGCVEPLKREVHRALGILAGVCCAYNAGAWIVRRQTHSAMNVLIYALIVALEQAHVDHHKAAIK
jgi:hypothetical protein